jgi:phospholipase/carboxylesterase
MLSTIEINPSEKPIGTVILLHGLGADGNDFVSIVAELEIITHLPLRFVFPNAPKRAITINNGYVMPAWYDIVSMEMNQRADRKGIDESVKQIQQIIEHEKTLGISEDKIIMAGFSQGAVIAMVTGIFHLQKLKGILALSGYLPYTTTDLQQAPAANHQTPIFLGHGMQDNVVPFIFGRGSYEVLKKSGFNVAWHDYPMGHSVSAREIEDIARWLKELYRLPSEDVSKTH